jgi:hypothetical protein
MISFEILYFSRYVWNFAGFSEQLSMLFSFSGKKQKEKKQRKIVLKTERGF